jgi:hypothetical protein
MRVVDFGEALELGFVLEVGWPRGALDKNLGTATLSVTDSLSSMSDRATPRCGMQPQPEPATVSSSGSQAESPTPCQ